MAGGARTAARRAVSYQLDIELSQPLRLRIGALGRFDFPAGRYRYTGSALRALDARIARHLAPHKTLRWHIDHLLAGPGVRVTRVRRSSRAECPLNQAAKGVVLVPGFGSSDCRAGCGAHLKFLGPATAAREPQGQASSTRSRPSRLAR